jgi:hypothetical protein
MKMLLVVNIFYGNNFLHIFTCMATDLDNAKGLFTVQHVFTVLKLRPVVNKFL